MNPNFIQFRLCDNDFGQELEVTARLVHEALGTGDICVSERRMKGIVVHFVGAMKDLRAASVGFERDAAMTHLYLVNQLTVEFTDQPPTVDHDGGSVCVNRRTNYIWRF